MCGEFPYLTPIGGLIDSLPDWYAVVAQLVRAQDCGS